ncbi:hypothetical protein FSP39_009059 [Pinctada imbricata]|uniref:Uncharacterized protein n=1 Tax=Pinctada imbricata TaxID=66713 RepID=A0AA88XN32_PINIB|nr:hypothetical protein FSP39_009059 [Pinctada imbricata]
MQQTFKDAVSTVEYTVKGNTVTVKTSSSAFPGKERVQTFTAGVPFDDVGLDGTPFKKFNEKESMMAKFQGKWVDDPSVPKVNYKEMFDKIGMNEEVKQKFLTTTTTVEYIVDGDKFKAITSSTAFPGMEKTFTFTLGEPFEDTSYDGNPFKLSHDDFKGMDEETKQKYTSTTTTIEYLVEGDKFKAITSSSAFQGLDKTFTYTLGEPFEDTSYDGSHFKATVTLIGDDTLYEVGENEKYGQFEFTRQVEGNIMNVTGNMAGVKMSSQMKKVY